jgi:hypothetical protein
MQKLLLDSFRRKAARLRTWPWAREAIAPLERAARRCFLTPEYALHMANERKQPADALPAVSNYVPAFPWRIGVIRDAFRNHESFIAACQQRKVAYCTLDLFASDWLRQVRDSQCAAFVAWPSEFIAEWKSMYDERLRVLTHDLRKLLYPSYDALWLYGSKQRTQDWLEAHGYPHPKTWVFYEEAEAVAFLARTPPPLVVKLDIGAAADAVWIVRSAEEARRLLRRGFSKGLAGKKWVVGARQWRHLLFQEFLGEVREWRMIRIGDSYFGHEKGRLGQFHSGSGKVGWFDPPLAALNLLHEVTEQGNFRSMAMDVFQTPDGKLWVNELQSVFGARVPSQMYINGVPGRYRCQRGGFVFEEGLFCRNSCCDLRIEDLINILEAQDKA